MQLLAKLMKAIIQYREVKLSRCKMYYYSSKQDETKNQQTTLGKDHPLAVPDIFRLGIFQNCWYRTHSNELGSMVPN